MKNITRLNIGDHLLEYQVTLIGKTMSDAIKDDMWHILWTLSPEQYEKFRKYAVPLIKKTFKVNRTKAEEIFSWFYVQFGLRIE